jgi:outer membrane receptor protein involved in Fe transport
MKRKHNLGLAAALISAGVFAQDKTAAPATPAAAPPDQVSTVIVTGTSALRAGHDTPMSTTVFNTKDLARLSGSGQADLLATVPGIKAEGGGGEVAANVQVRGLPSDGQYQFTPLEYDGMPALSTYGLNSSAYDIFYRNDLGIQRMEFVTGGVSNLFGPGSVAGIINFISKQGTDKPQGTFQIEAADKGRVRTDIAMSGPLTENTYYALSGYYRYDEGPIKTGFATEGYQLRGNIKHKVDGGSVSVYAQVIDDSVQFFPPLPLDGNSLERTTDRYGNEIFTTNTSDARNLTSVLPNGQRYVSQIDKGAYTKGGSLALVLDRDLGNDWGLNVKTKVSSYQHQFNFFVDGDGIVNAPETLTQYLSNRGIAGTGAYTYADSGQALPANALLYANRVLNRNRPTSDFNGEANLTRKFDGGGITHNVTLGLWGARTHADDNSLTQTYLAEYANEPKLVNLVVNGVNYTRNGLVDPSVGYTHNTNSASRMATYLADQMEVGRWSFDAGARVERMKGSVNRELTSTYNGVGQGGAVEAPALTSVVYGNGQYLDGTVSTTEWATALSALYKVNNQLNVYGNYSRGFFFPELRSVSFDPQGNPQSYQGEIINQAELGLKYANGGFYGTVAAFISTLKNRRSVQFVNGVGGNILESVTLLSTRAPGMEASANYRLTRGLTVSGNFTLNDDRITEGPFDGNQLDRKPKRFANAALVYDDGKWDGNLSWNYQSDAFSSMLNNIVLPSYSLWRLGGGYKIALGGGQAVHFGASVYNLFNSQGLAEGSPRQGTNQVAGGAFFDGRPILPRRVTLTATYSY